MSAAGEGSGEARLSSKVPQIGTEFNPSVVEQQGVGSEMSTETVVDVDDDFPSEFAWDGRGYDLEEPYVELANQLADAGWISLEDEQGESELRCDHLGYSEYEHEGSDSVECPVETVYKPMLDVGRFHVQRSYEHRNRSGDRALDRLEHLKEEAGDRGVNLDYLMFIDLTCQGEVSERLLTDEREDLLDRFKSAVSDFYRRLYEEMNDRDRVEEFDVDYGIVKKQRDFAPMRTVHTWASKNPLKPHLHTHTVIPNVVVESIKERKKNLAGLGAPDIEEESYVFHRIKPFIDYEVLRKVWQEVLEDYGLWIDNGQEPVLNIESIKFRGSGRVATEQGKVDNSRIHHKLSYMCRLPLEDLNENLEMESRRVEAKGKNGNQYDFKKIGVEDADLDFAAFLMNYTTVRANLGFGHDLKRMGYKSHKSIPVRCPICQCELRRTGEYRDNLPDKVHMVRNNEGFWEVVPPPPAVDGDEDGDAFQDESMGSDEDGCVHFCESCKSDFEIEKEAVKKVRMGGREVWLCSSCLKSIGKGSD